MPQFRIVDAARLLGVSDDTVRGRVDTGTLPVQADTSSRTVIHGAALAARCGAGRAGRGRDHVDERRRANPGGTS